MPRSVEIAAIGGDKGDGNPSDRALACSAREHVDRNERDADVLPGATASRKAAGRRP